MEGRSPRSPALFPKSPMVYENYKSGCAWGLMGIFDFRQGNANRKRVSDKRRLKNRSLDNKCTRKKHSSLSEFEKKCECDNKVNRKKNVQINSRVIEVSQITEEDMRCKLPKAKNIPTEKPQTLPSNSENVDRIPKKQRTNKSSKKPCPMQTLNGKSVDRTSNKFETTTTTTTTTSPSQVFDNQERNCSYKSTNYKKNNNPVPKEKVHIRKNNAAEAFIDQKLTDGKCLSIGAASNQPKHFFDALEILNSNKSLFKKLLQDPNSLLVKQIQDFQDSQVNNHPAAKLSSKAEFIETKIEDFMEFEDPDCAQNRKACESFVHSDTNVLFKHDSTRSKNSGEIVDQFSEPSVKNLPFSFKQMKRKLRDAIGVNKKDITPKSRNDSTMSEGVGEDTVKEIILGNNSERITEIDVRGIAESSRDVFMTRVQKINDANDFGLFKPTWFSTCERGHEGFVSSTFRHPKEIESKLYFGSREHLSNKLHYENDVFVRRQISESLGSLTYDFVPPCRPRSSSVYDFVNAQMGYSHSHSRYRYYPNFKGNKSRREKYNLNGCLSFPVEYEEYPVFSDYMKPVVQTELSDANRSTSKNLHWSIRSCGEESRPIEKHGELMDTNVPYGLHSGSDTSTNHSDDATNIHHEDQCRESSNLDSRFCNLPSTTICDAYSSLRSRENEDCNIMRHANEHPRLASENLETIKPLTAYRRNVEELHSSQSLKVTDESALEYIKAVIHASGLNQDALLLKCHSFHSDQLLESSIFDQVKTMPLMNQSYSNHKLLFDYTNEVLQNLYQQHYVGSFPWSSFTRQKLEPFTVTTDLGHEVMNCIEWHLLLDQHHLPQTFEELFEKDLVKSTRSWIDFGVDMEDVLVDIAGDILQELIGETGI